MMDELEFNFDKTAELPSAEKQLVFIKLIQQLEKDLYITNFNYRDNKNDDFTDLVEQVYQNLIEAKQTDSNSILRVFNRVDISPKQAQRLAAMQGDYLLNAAKGIVIRELQKVLIRINNSKL